MSYRPNIRKKDSNREEYYKQQFSEWFNAEELVDNLKKFYPQPPSVPLNTKEIFDHLKILYDDDNYIELEDNIDFDNDDSQIIIDDTRGLLKKFLEDVLRDTIIYMENGKRRTVTYMDV
ncbi:948_t:CDS:2, partial [Entrophospora sp. SA101]